MTSSLEIPLATQRALLRRQIHAQREVIAAQLEQTTAENNSYPRSMIMRFLTQQSGAKIAAEFATVVLGAKFLKSMMSALALAKIVRSIAPGKPKEKL